MTEAKIIDGKQVSALKREEIKRNADEFERTRLRKVGLSVVLVGDNSASQVYVRNKIKACEETNIKSFAYYLSEMTKEEELLELIETLNNDKNVDGILVQLPLPKHLNEKRILSFIKPGKDVDGFHAVNAGNLMLGNGETLAACTPAGIMELLKSINVNLEGLNAVVVGRSNIVGKPIALLLLEKNATVTVCHSKTKDLAAKTLSADVLVVAVGIKEFIKGDMIKEGAVVIDVGMNRADGKLCGDVEFSSAVLKASYITPVPGGVGPMTITMLMSNTVKAANLAK